MRRILISDADLNKLLKIKEKEINIAYKKFCERKKIHLKNDKLKSFYNLCTEDFNPILYTIPFKCFFSFYLYLYLKNHVERFEFDRQRYQFLYSKPLDINFSEISRLAHIPINTVKAAYSELIKFEFLIYSELLTPNESNQNKCAMLVNDFFIVNHHAATNKTIFAIKKP